MTLAHLVICTGSIYASFLLWALLQERLTTTPYTLPISLQHATNESRNEFFKSPLVLNALQAIICTVIAAIYLTARSIGSKEPLHVRLGFDALTPAGADKLRKNKQNGVQVNGKSGKSKAVSASPSRVSPLLLRYIQIAASQSVSSLLALHSLSHGISYPTLTLAKSCKLVPVLFANVLLYRRKFAPYKYVVVLLVTVGISMFMLFGESASSKKKIKPGQERSSMVGLLLLLGNQALDGITNSTQDEVFGTYTLSGPKMMLIMNAISAALMGTSLLVPVPTFLGGSGTEGSGELASALSFIQRHPEILRDLFGYALAGALGQIAIFETLERFGSLTLVAITVTRKLFTMLLSIVVYKHTLKQAQWLGVLIVFVGLGIEAREKKREGMAKKVLAEKRAAVKDA
ncbi:UAA transporter [Meira miltonrushii]|uniref:UDP-galactose transporter homolog 1 n=1 Tax=Meira miltonrushii TaxID=1280837 RepID=A0A316VJL5_9BASI|nr:UAA transporter [Meira miltonrushii]PWN35695.1 UAA transporter [Meira miltonrushii]